MVPDEWRLRLLCPNCTHPIEEWIDAPVADLTAETAHDAESTAEFDVTCDTCGEVAYVEVTAHLTGWTAHILGEPGKTITIDHLDHGDDDWIEELEPEPHPYENFKRGHDEWTGLLHRIGDPASGAADTNRLLLIQLFSIVEAYLSDAIIRHVHAEPDACIAIVAWHPELKTEAVSLKAVAENPFFVRDMVIAKLRRTQFHRFEHINGLLRACLDHHLLPTSKEERNMVMGAAKARHDCVHRNGRDHEGNVVTFLTVPYLKQLSQLFNRMILDVVATLDEIELRNEKSMHLAESSRRLAELGEDDDLIRTFI